jgi:hypothetical protein
MVAFNDRERTALIFPYEQDGSQFGIFLPHLTADSPQFAVELLVKFRASVADAFYDFIHVESAAGELAPLCAREEAKTLYVGGL